jgi:diguanylate cyclase (GGDEF)-like protein
MAVDEDTRLFRAPAAPDGGKRDRAYLVVLAGASVGEMYKVEGQTTVIGRGQRAQIRLLDDGISREHAQLVQKGDKIVLEDLGSTNGTFCNGLRIEKKELADGDKILVGSTTILKFTYHDNLDEIFQKQMYESALRDSLTKAFNKRYFTDRLENEFTFAVRHGTPLSLVLFDVDHFKRVNDTFGHQAGDQVLSGISGVLAGSLRVEDVFARYGGEEFAVICRGSDLSQGQIVGERLRKAVEGHPFSFDDQAIPITISVGVAGLPDPEVRDATELIGAADAAMYRSKDGGRNRVTVHKPGDPMVRGKQ